MSRYELAIVEFTEAIKIKPEERFFLYMRSEAYRSVGRYDFAIMDATEIIRLKPESTWFGYRAALYTLMGKTAEAAADQMEVVRLERKKPITTASKGGFLGWLGIN